MTLTAETISLATSCVIVNGLSVTVVFSLHQKTTKINLKPTKPEGTHKVQTHTVLLLTLTLTIQPQNHTTGYPKIIPYTNFEHFGGHSFLNYALGKQTDRQTDETDRLEHLPTPIDRVGVGNNGR